MFVPTILLVALSCRAVPAVEAEKFGERRPAARWESIVDDWIQQDYTHVELPIVQRQELENWRDAYLKSPESRLDAPVLPHFACFEDQRGSLLEERMLRNVLAELCDERAGVQSKMESLVRSNVPGRDDRWKDLYLQACELRRARRLQTLRSRWTRFVFDQHRYVGHSYKYTELLSDAHTDRQRFFKPGAMIGMLELDGIYGQVRTLIEDPKGILRNPDVSYDGHHVLFAWKKSDRDDDFHLYVMDVENSAVRQLTHGAGAADFEGVFLPDGNILFSSTRCCQTVDCNWVDVSNLYLMSGDGRFARRVGFDQVHTVFPTVTDEGLALYTRWEYNDRGQIYPQPLFQMNADGTDQRAVYGINSWYPTNIIHARKIPNSRKLLAVVTGHHRPAQGKLALIDPAQGREEGAGIQLLAPTRKADYVRVDKYAADGDQFQYPYPLDEEHFLVTLARPTPKGAIGRFNIYFMDREGRRELLVEGRESGDGIGCRQIIPLDRRPRPPIRRSLVDYRKDSGTFFLQDIYEGAGLKGIPRGSVRKLRVVSLQYRTAAIGSLWQEGLGGSSEVTTPVAVGNAAWDVKVVLGLATVYPDGSAMFRAPARTPVYFQALDERGDVVQTMRSWSVLQPGETQSCVGCHEGANRTPAVRGRLPLALRAGVEDLMDGSTQGFSFAREIQPILDRHCVRCHTGEADKPLDLTSTPVALGATKRWFSQSYLTLTHTKGSCGDWQHEQLNWIDCMSEPTMLPPYYRGAATSGLVELLRKGHEDVQLSRQELEKFSCWIDLLVPFCGDYLEAHNWSRDDLELYARATSKREKFLAIEQADLTELMRESQTLTARAHSTRDDGTTSGPLKNK